MNKNTFNQQIKDRLLQETESSTHLKKETWNNIEKELFSEKKKKNKTVPWLLAAGFAVIMLFTVLGSSTDIVQAMFQNIKDLFVEEKQQEVEIEGQTEEIDVQLQVNEELSYVVYINDERYKMEKNESSDRVIPSEELGERYPEVSMEIRKEDNTSREAVIEEIKQNMDGLVLRAEEEIDEPMEATRIRAIAEEDANWDTPVYKWYITPTEEGQVFVIKQSYFLEAAEGHGARFDQILESFEIVKE